MLSSDAELQKMSAPQTTGSPQEGNRWVGVGRGVHGEALPPSTICERLGFRRCSRMSAQISTYLLKAHKQDNPLIRRGTRRSLLAALSAAGRSEISRQDQFPSVSLIQNMKHSKERERKREQRHHPPKQPALPQFAPHTPQRASNLSGRSC